MLLFRVFSSFTTQGPLWFIDSERNLRTGNHTLTSLTIVISILLIISCSQTFSNLLLNNEIYTSIPLLFNKPQYRFNSDILINILL